MTDPTRETNTNPEFISHTQKEDRLLPLKLHDGSTGSLSLDDYDLILTIDHEGEVNIAIASGVDPKDAGAALASMGLDLQHRG